MKKLIYLIILTVILGLVLTGCLLSNVGQVPTSEQSGISYLTKGGTTEAEAEEVILYAGQYENVGVVKVWNDTENLYVKYIVDDPWCLTETHLHVAANPDGIPQTKKGNPIPGQFDYEGEHDCEQYFLYTIPLADLNVELFIAAHAVVVDTGTIETEVDLKWGRSFEDGSSICSSLNLGDAVTCGLALPVNVSQTVWDKNTWAYWTQYPVDNVSTYRFQVRHFQALFDLPKEIKPDNVEDLILFSPYDHFDKDNLPVNDIILINDNLYVYLNNIEIGRKGTCYPPASLDWYVSPDVGWYVPGSFSADGPQNLIVGPNIIDIVAEESCGWGGMGQLGLKLIWHPEESAWAGKEPLPGDNWATCFTYSLEEVLIDTVTVGSDGAVYCSSLDLDIGENYRLEVSGTYEYWPAQSPDAGIADAKYSLRPNSYCNNTGSAAWISGDDLFICYGVRYLELLLDGLPQPWGTFNETHNYSIEYIGTGNTVCFKILDTAYGDNSGSLIVEIYWIP